MKHVIKPKSLTRHCTDFIWALSHNTYLTSCVSPPCPPPETASSSQSLPCKSSLLRRVQENSPPCWAPFCNATNFLAGCHWSLSKRWGCPARDIHLSMREGGVGMNWTVTTVPFWGRVRTHWAEGVSHSLTSPWWLNWVYLISERRFRNALPSAPEANVRPSMERESTVTEFEWPSMLAASKLSAVTATSLGGDLSEKWEMVPDWLPT